MLRALLLGLQLTASGPVGSSTPELAPGTVYDPDVPTLAAVVGHDAGERITTPEEIAKYLEALHKAEPSRTALVRYGTSWENRPLWLFIVGSAERIASLERVKADLRRLADPRSISQADGERLVRSLPVVTWLMHGVHGNEVSGSDAALVEAYHLLAARADPDVDAILRESIVVIDPMQNPDGRARFVAANLLAGSATADADPVAAEHDEPWPGGRSNHYLFDMNRDWFAQSQPETRGRVRAMLEWYPHVVADLHEMSGDSTYYFAPPANPINPHVTADQRAMLEVFGRANAARFDERGFAYFVRETYDAFYPGYGESWPVFHGAVGMTFEQASARGLRWRRSDDQLLTYRDGVLHHFTAAMTTAVTAARNRERLLRAFLAFRRSAAAPAAGDAVRDYVLLPGSDRSRAQRLARLLAAQGIDVRRTVAPIAIAGRQIPAGAYLVSAAQPASRLVRNLLDTQTEPDSVFVREQQRRRRLQLPEESYDVTAWSLPLLFDVEVVAAKATLRVASVPLDSASGPGASSTLPAARVAYVLPWGGASAALVAEALAEGIRVRHAALPFTVEGRPYSAGSAVIRVAENGADLAQRLGRLAARHDAEIIPVQTGYPDEGISLGSARVTALKMPRVLMAWDLPTSPLSAGWARYVLEQQVHVPVTIVRVSSIARVDLDSYDVVVLPSADYGATGGEEFPRRLREWTRQGGTLVTLAEASAWAVSVGLLDSRVEDLPAPPRLDSLRASSSGRGSEASAGESVASGSILRAHVDQTHWLASGHDDEVHVLADGHRPFTPISADRGRNVVAYATAPRLLASGLLWDEVRTGLAEKAFLIDQEIGQGHVVAFAEDPNYRAFAQSTVLLFVNAILLGPAY